MMATVQVLRAAQRTASAWRNGGGITREIAASPQDADQGADIGDFHWRVSLADVARGGPFSAFPGVDRVITVVRGAGMALTVDGVEHTVDAPYRPFAFPGDAATDCRLLDGPLVDFNVMTRRGHTTAKVDLVHRATTLTGPTTLAVLLDGSASLHGTGQTLDPFDAVLLTDGGDESDGVLLDVQGTAAVITFRRTA